MKKIAALFVFLCLHLLSHAQGGIWTWVKGDFRVNAPSFGIKGVTSSTSAPNEKYQSIQWTDLDGNFWIFGGVLGTDVMNDLWKYEPATNNWTWMNGSDTLNGIGIYGTQGIPGPNNLPGARGWGARSWTDLQGRFWLNGGYGYDIIGNYGLLDDMWMYDPLLNQWTWMKGVDTISVIPNYGTKQIETATNTPGGRQECNTAWLKSDGTLWTFGGTIDTGASYNDMWRFNISTNNWTWMCGPQGINSSHNYGTYTVEDSNNLPPGRLSYTHWQDANDNFFFFGGGDYVGGVNSSNIIDHTFNDVWRYNTGNNQWTWIGGSNSYDPTGYYGQFCLKNRGFPASRFENRTAQSSLCSDLVWCFGGTDKRAFNSYNDLWCYKISSGEWTWVSGVGATNYLSTNLGTMGVPSPTNNPGCRFGPCFWADQNGTLWMWSGQAGSIGGDMWRFDPDTSCIHSSVTVTPISIQISDSAICLGDSTFLSISDGRIVSAVPFAGVIKMDSTHLIISPEFSTSYKVIAMSSCGLRSTLYLNIQVIQPSLYTLNQTICLGDSLLFHGQTLYSAGDYKDTLTTALGCDSIITLHLSMPPRPIASFSLQPIGDSVALGPISVTNTSMNSDTILWLLNNQLTTLTHDSVLSIKSSGNYCIRLIASSNAGCSDTTQQCIYVFENAFAMPNAFTPNGDGKNDIFYPVFISQNGMTVTNFKIYNRWGQLVYDDPNYGWDGRYNGEAQSGEAYTYFISVSMPDSSHPGHMKEIKKEGSFALIR